MSAAREATARRRIKCPNEFQHPLESSIRWNEPARFLLPIVA
jgi:hypothetical protein